MLEPPITIKGVVHRDTAIRAVHRDVLPRARRRDPCVRTPVPVGHPEQLGGGIVLGGILASILLC